MTAPEPVSEDDHYDSLCPWCDGYGLIEIFHPSTDGLTESHIRIGPPVTD